MRVISASAANRKSRSRAISDEVQVSKNEFLFAAVVADGDAAGETTKLLDSRMAQAEGVSTSRSAAVSGRGFMLWIEHSCVRTKQFWGTTSMHFWTVTFMGGTVVRALSNGQVGPPEGTLPRYLAKVPPPPTSLPAQGPRWGGGGGPPCRPKVQGEVGGGTLSGVPGTLGR